MPAVERPALTEYLFHTPITSRWGDNDIYGHINNVAYYSYFDSAANLYLIEVGGLDIHNSSVIGLVVESHCEFHAPLAYPTPLIAGLRVDRLGNRAVTYGIAIFAEGDELAAAHGHFVHVFVDRTSRKPVPIPPSLREALAAIATS
ncbi:MAG TPA: thioesterase family protein [Kofleriaceae bacterium]|nr:thioesterase family protein [Kofleriaceae bacterium]